VRYFFVKREKILLIFLRAPAQTGGSLNSNLLSPESMKFDRCLHFLFTPILALTVASPLLAESSDNMISAPAGSALPPSMQKAVQGMVELKDAPAGVAYAQALKQAQAQYDQQRTYALQHPNLRTSQ